MSEDAARMTDTATVATGRGPLPGHVSGKKVKR